MLRMYKTAKIAVPVEISRLKEQPSLKKKDLQELRCTCCSHKLGCRPWSSAWIEYEDQKRPVRLCADCTEDAREEMRCDVP